MDADYAKLAGSESPFAQRAAHLLGRGFSVIPVSVREKDTRVGACARTRDAAQVSAWAESGFFDANVGLCADENFTLLESDNIPALRERVRELAGQEIPRTLHLGSGRDNRGCWVFRRTLACGERCPSSEGLFEFRNWNQYVVGPGSIHPFGLTYRWLDDVPVTAMPDWLVEVIHKLNTDGKQAREAVLHAPGERVPVGQRHDFLKSQGGRLLSAGIDLESLETHFLYLNAEKFAEPESENVIRAQARDMYNRWHDEPRVIIVNDQDPGKALVGVGRLLCDAQPKDVDWLWEPYIPQGMITILTGDPGAGKSYIALSVTARLSLLGRSTVYMTIENSPEFTLRPRFDSLGGDPSRIFLLEGVGVGGGEIRGVQLQDIGIIRQSIQRYGARLVVIDPIQSYLGAHVDAHRANETRPVMDSLVRLAESTGAAVLIVRHGSKNGSGRAIYKGQGSIDFTAAARSELMAGETPDHQRALVHIKGSIGPMGKAQGYVISSTNPAGEIVKAGYFRWTGECEINSADLMEIEKKDGAQDEAKDFLRELLASSPRLATECIEEGKQVGISQRTLERAKSGLRVRAYRLVVPGPWNWSLPASSTPPIPKEQKLGGLGGLANPQHTNLLTTTNLANTAKTANISPLGEVDGLVGGLGMDRKNPSSPVLEPRDGNRWESEDEEES